MLAGIGGRTIAEAKQSMSYAEALDWAEYRRLRGSFNAGTRIEWSSALLSMMINRATGGKAEMSDYMPHADEPEATIEYAMRNWE